MDCKYCNAHIEEDHLFCPYCGKSLVESEEQPVESTETGAVEVEVAPEKKKSVWKLVLAISGGVVALGLLAVLLLYAFGVKLTPRANDIYNKDSFTIAENKALKKADVVVAEVNGVTLSNAQLQIYYRMQIEEFLSYYGSYLSMLGLDYTKSLGEQTCYFDTTMTWEQYFLKNAIDTWYNHRVFANLAEEAGFALDADWQAEFDKIPTEMEEQAKTGEYESVDAMVKDILGPGCTLDDYIEYVKLLSLGSEFYATECERLTPNEQEIESYFTENEAAYKENGVTKESGLVSDVRHILICPQGGTTDENNETTYSEAEWEACRQKAQQVLDEWKAGEATEVSFAKLVATYTEDDGSKETGGLYEQIAPGSNYVEEFLAWAIDMNRKPGDTDLVKTQFGYHIMYFVEGEAQWISAARSDLTNQRVAELVANGEAKWPLEVNYRKITLVEPKLA